MGYFRELPNIEMVNRIKTDVSIDEKVIIKNFFRRAKIRDDILSVVTAFENYQIKENETPSQVAEKIYGEPELDWVVLTANNIINVQDDWPINANSFNNYLLNKYGSESALEEVHHYETIELKDSFGRVVLPGGLLVDEAFYNAPEFRNFATAPIGINFPPEIIPGTTAVASVVLGNQNYNSTSVVGIASLQSGLGYKSPPTVTFSNPTVTANASVNATINNFSVTSFNTLAGGKGYLSAPTITIESPPDPIQSTASCIIDSPEGKVTTITGLSAGLGYGLTAPTVTFAPPPKLIIGSYFNQSALSVGTQIDGMFVREDGLNLYTTNISGSGLIKQFSMSIGWDVATLAFVRELNVSANFSYCTGIEFKSDGTRMFVVGGAGGSFKLVSYNLSTPWDISTATLLHQIVVASPGAVRISPNGLKLFFLKSSTPYLIEQYNLSTAWNITSISEVIKSINLQQLTGELTTLGFTFSSNGLKLLTTSESNSRIYEFNLQTLYDLENANLINNFYVGDKISNPSDIFVKPDASTFFVCGGIENKVFQYQILSLAKGTATLNQGTGTVSNINIDQAGFGYTVAPAITISAPFPSIQATATAIMTADVVVTKTWSVFSNSNSFYTFTGSSSGSNISIIATAGDTLVFNVNASGHPFWIKTAPTVGTGNSVTTGTITNNGKTANVGVGVTVTWNTAGVIPGTYYYICQNHRAMRGTIIINAASTGSFVSSINVTNSGFGYVYSPSVSISSAPASRTAFGVAILNQTTGISTVAIVDGGSNYTSPPTITFETPDQIENLTVNQIYSQNNKTWRWNGTRWQEKFTEEFQYLDPTISTILKTRGSLISKPITNYQYETDLNEKKRGILILKPQYLAVIITDLKNIMTYDSESSTYINDKLKSSFNPKFTTN